MTVVAVEELETKKSRQEDNERSKNHQRLLLDVKVLFCKY